MADKKKAGTKKVAAAGVPDPSGTWKAPDGSSITVTTTGPISASGFSISVALQDNTNAAIGMTTGNALVFSDINTFGPGSWARSFCGSFSGSSMPLQVVKQVPGATPGPATTSPVTYTKATGSKG